jgi:hypothetical protein
LKRLTEFFCGLAENRLAAGRGRVLFKIGSSGCNDRFPGHGCPQSQCFYVNSGGLRAGKGSAIGPNFPGVINEITCDLAAAAPKSAPRRTQARTGWIEQMRDWTTL